MKKLLVTLMVMVLAAVGCQQEEPPKPTAEALQAFTVIISSGITATSAVGSAPGASPSRSVVGYDNTYDFGNGMVVNYSSEGTAFSMEVAYTDYTAIDGSVLNGTYQMIYTPPAEGTFFPYSMSMSGDLTMSSPEGTVSISMNMSFNVKSETEASFSGTFTYNGIKYDASDMMY